MTTTPLPPLPDAANSNFPSGRAGFHAPRGPAYTADQMHSYATQARDDLEAENARLREALNRYQFIRRHSYVLRVFVNGTHGELMQPSPGHLPDEDFDAEIDKLRAALKEAP